MSVEIGGEMSGVMSTPGKQTPDPEFEKLRAFLDMNEEATGKSWSRSIVRRLLNERDALLAAVAVDPEAPTARAGRGAYMRRFHEHIDGFEPLYHGYCDEHLEFNEGRCGERAGIAEAVDDHNARFHAAPVVADPGEAAAALDRVRELHQPMKVWEDDRTYTLLCRECTLKAYPCPTVAALAVSRTTPTEQEP